MTIRRFFCPARRAWACSLALLLGALEARAQGAAPDTAQGWSADLKSHFSAAQAGYRNWSKGGVNSLAFTIKLDGTAQRRRSGWLNKHEMRLAYGLVKQEGDEMRKADDLINLNSSLQYEGEGFFQVLNPTVASQLRTQFAPGYDLKKDPLNGGRTPPVKISGFFAPATLTQSVGLTYNAGKQFTHRFGVGAKETVVAIRRFRPFYHGDTHYRPVRFEVGLESRTQLERELVENVRLKTTLGLFAAFNQDVPDVIWENVVAMKVNSWLGVNFEFDTVYERDYRPSKISGKRLDPSDKVQIKELLSLGVTVVII